MDLFDTLAGTRLPLPEGRVSLYVCGVTPYDTTHLGHAFTFVQFDTFVRALRWLGREVAYVQNVTDIDDSILQRARKTGRTWRELGDEQTAQYEADMQALNVAGPDHFVRATSAIATMQTMIGWLLEKKLAYAAEGGTVFFRVAAAPEYGQLSRLTRPAMLEVAGQQDDADLDDPRKEDPLDFAVWKGWSGAEDEPCWQSPWGAGRPGWHIECSAMCYQYFGPQVTIHGGGRDLVFPHHESEIVQSEGATGVRPFVQRWMHVAMVRMDGEKMSKSLGNMVFVRDLLRDHTPDGIRLYLLSHRYQDPFSWSASDLEESQRLAELLALAARQPDQDGGAHDEVTAALADDLNTPRVVEALTRASGEPLRRLAGAVGLTLIG